MLDVGGLKRVSWKEDGGAAKKRKPEIEIMENEKLSWDGG